MQSVFKRLGCIAALALVTHAGMAAAQPAAAPSPQTTAAGVRYVSGGVGETQESAMRDIRGDYNLHLTFARAGTGEFLADVKVQIDQEGRQPFNAPVLATMSGPMLYVMLPDGQYRVRAETGGEVQNKVISISRGRARDLIVHFTAVS
jgi:hypothetical protein